MSFYSYQSSLSNLCKLKVYLGRILKIIFTFSRFRFLFWNIFIVCIEFTKIFFPQLLLLSLADQINWKWTIYYTYTLLNNWARKLWKIKKQNNQGCCMQNECCTKNKVDIYQAPSKEYKWLRVDQIQPKSYHKIGQNSLLFELFSQKSDWFKISLLLGLAR